MSSAMPRFVLFEPTHPGNVGAAARAIKTMGFDQLVLVNPRCEIGSEAVARSSGALDVLEAATVVPALSDAVGDCGYIVGVSARRRTLNWPEFDPRGCAAEVVQAVHDAPVALLFGPERAGLSNAELDLCHALVSIPSNPEYGSLNLAMAVQIIAYELRLAMPGMLTEAVSAREPAPVQDMEYFYAHLQRALIAGGFLDPANPRHLMRRLRRLFNRARVDRNELNILRGMLSALAPGTGDNEPAEPRRNIESG